uniref:RRM domain-containing protein n=1 Tax=Panagrolaimus sp. ES5 TaxID=591445 RepID=A0AC34FYF6_9BILA
MSAKPKLLTILASIQFESALYGGGGGGGVVSATNNNNNNSVGNNHQELYSQSTSSSISPSSSILLDRKPFKILQPPEKRARIDTPSSTSSSIPSPTNNNNNCISSGNIGGMSVQTNGGNNDNDIFTNGHTENSSKITSANSIESLDNCSTVSSGDPSNQVRTLFVSGLPMDTKPRELYLLFRAYSGYESSLLKVTNKNGKPSAPVGFVTFTTHQDANEARRKLQGVRFDPELSQTIRLELAKSNTKVSKPKQPSPPAFTPGGGGVITPNNNSGGAGFLPLHSHSAHEQAGLLAAAAASNNMFEQIQALNDQQ